MELYVLNRNTGNHFTMCKNKKKLSLIGLVGTVFANGPGDRGSIPGRVIPTTL